MKIKIKKYNFQIEVGGIREVDTNRTTKESTEGGRGNKKKTGTGMRDKVWRIISDVNGSISFLSSFVSLFPQIIETYHDKTVDGLSPYFLLCWLMGDITSLIGAVMTDQLRFQIMLVIYFLLNDLFVCGQYYYYGVVYKNSLATVGHEPMSVVISRMNSAGSVISGGGGGDRNINGLISVISHASLVSGMGICGGEDKSEDTKRGIEGIILSWIGALFYVGARIPQLIKNYRRKSTDGISPFLFATTLIGNITYNISIFTSVQYINSGDKWGFVRRTLPFIFGSAGTIVFDLIYFYQYYVLYVDDTRLRTMERQLLGGESTTTDPEAADPEAAEQTPLLWQRDGERTI